VDAVAYFDGEADVVTLMLWEAFDWETANYLEVVVVFDRNGDAKLQSGVRLPKEDFPIAKHMLGERVWLFEDALTDPRMDSVTANNWAMLGIRSFMGPALYHGNRWIGGITFHSSHPRHYTQREVRLFAAIGDLVVAAIERIRLQQETEAARQAAERFAEQAQQLAAFQERNRLARELHDSVSQVLYSISLWGHSTRAFLKYDPSRISESVDHILSLTEVGLSEMRALIFELRPESLEEEGIISALSKQAESLQAHHGVQITTEFCDEPHLILQKKSDLYWIAREALHNAIKHAQATHITLSLLEIEAGYCLEISDNGLGFDTSQSFPGHLGFTSMQERTAVIKGSMNIKSTLGVGTQITLTLHS
jgi:signal transduction histidine kinase